MLTSWRSQRANKLASLLDRLLYDTFALVTFGGGWNSRTGGEPEEETLFGEPATLRA
jgi:hypothetical protein